MQIEVLLKQVVETSIPANLELRSDSEFCAGFFCLLDALDNPLGIAFEVQGPLVEATRSNGHEVSHDSLWYFGASGL